MKRIGIDYRPALKVNSRRRGIGRYTYEIVSAILETDSPFRFLLYSLEADAPLPPGKFEVRRLFNLAKPSRMNWIPDALLWRRRFRQDDLQLFHAMDLTSVPRKPHCRLVVTIHDLIPFVFWQETSRELPYDFRIALQRGSQAAAAADLIITDSEHSRRDIIERWGVSAESIRVVYLGCSLKPLAESADRTRLGTAEGRPGARYLLYVGGSDFRKNLGLLLDAFSLIVKGGYPGRLRLVGETFASELPEVLGLKERARKAGISDRVDFLGFLDDRQLAGLYAGCDFFVFPSLYEGFGLPVLEAMNCGAPLLLARSSSIPEVAGEAAAYFDPMSVDDLVSRFWEAWETPDRVEERRQAARTRALRFSWREAGASVVKAYREVLEGTGASGVSGGLP